MKENTREISILKRRILEYLDIKGVSKYECYKNTGITNGVLSQSNGLSEDNLMRFLSYYTDLSYTWLFTGQGKMLKQTVQNQKDSAQSSENALIFSDKDTKNNHINQEETSYIYKMYEKKDEESRALIRENGRLEERLRSMEQELGALKSKYPHESPPGIVRENGEVLGSSETAKDAHSKRRTPASEPSYKHL